MEENPYVNDDTMILNKSFLLTSKFALQTAVQTELTSRVQPVRKAALLIVGSAQKFARLAKEGTSVCRLRDATMVKSYAVHVMSWS